MFTAGSILANVDFVVTMLLISGILTLRLDTKRYKISGMVRERKAARFIGWLNISLSIVVFSVNWIYMKWIL